MQAAELACQRFVALFSFCWKVWAANIKHGFLRVQHGAFANLVGMGSEQKPAVCGRLRLPNLQTTAGASARTMPTSFQIVGFFR